MIRKTASFLASAFLLTGLVSCTSSDVYNQASDGKISVVTTIFPQYDFTRQIGGDNINVTMLLKPGAESHTYEPTPMDIIKIKNCDLFIYNGGEGDVWIDTILESLDTSVNTLAMMDCVETVEEEIIDGMTSKEEEEGEEEPEMDEHVWTSPENAVKIVSEISDRLCECDSDNAETYISNTERYISELNELDNRFSEIVSQGNRKTIVFGDRFPFRYFADAYGLDYYAAFPGCSSESEPGASTMIYLVDKIKSENLPAVFTIEFSSRKIAETLSESTGAEILEFHSCHNVTTDDLENGETYISIMNRNADNLKKALS